MSRKDGKIHGADYNYNQNTMFAARNVARLAPFNLISLFFFSADNIPTPAASQTTVPKGNNTLAAQIAPLSSFRSAQVESPKKAEPVEYVLTKQALDLCSPLMRSILKSVSNQKLTISSQSSKTLQQKPNTGPSTLKHNLLNFHPMLASQCQTSEQFHTFLNKKQYPLVADVKYDGQRTFIKYERGVGLQMVSRNGKTQVGVYHQIYGKILEQLNASDINSIALDGEIMLIDRKTGTPKPLNELMKYRAKKEVRLIDDDDENEECAFAVYIFDVVEKNGVDHLRTELLQRRKMIPTLPIFKTVDYRIINSPEENIKIEEFFKEALNMMHEGIIVKGGKDLYYTNTSRTHWAKMKRGFLKTRDENYADIHLDLIVMGASFGKGNDNKTQLTSFLCGAYDKGKIVPFSNVGSGLTDQTRKHFATYIQKYNLVVAEDSIPSEYDLGKVRVDVYLKPELVFQVHAQQFMESPKNSIGDEGYGGLTLRFPVFKCHRFDKSKEQATTAEEIIEISKSFLFRANQTIDSAVPPTVAASLAVTQAATPVTPVQIATTPVQQTPQIPPPFVESAVDPSPSVDDTSDF